MAFTFNSSTTLTEVTSDPITITGVTSGNTTIAVLTMSYPSTGSTRSGGAPTGTASIMGGKTYPLDYGGMSACTDGFTEIWYAINNHIEPLSGLTVTLPNTGELSISLNLSTYKTSSGNWSEFDQSVSFSGSDSSSPSVTITATTAGLIVDSLFNGYNSLIGFGNNRTLLYNDLSANDLSASQYYINPSSGATVMSYTTGAKNVFVMTAVSFIEAIKPNLKSVNGVLYQDMSGMDDTSLINIESVSTVLKYS